MTRTIIKVGEHLRKLYLSTWWEVPPSNEGSPYRESRDNQKNHCIRSFHLSFQFPRLPTNQKMAFAFLCAALNFVCSTCGYWSLCASCCRNLCYTWTHCKFALWMNDLISFRIHRESYIIVATMIIGVTPCPTNRSLQCFYWQWARREIMSRHVMIETAHT